MDNKKTTDSPRVIRGSASGKRRKRKPSSLPVRVTKRFFSSTFKIVASIILILTIAVCIVGTVMTVYVMNYIQSEPVINLDAIKLNFNSSVYGLDENGGAVEVQSLREGENRIWVDLKDVPQHVQDAFVYSEDERFNEHSGVDFKRTIAAFVNEVMRKLGMTQHKFGGSTITQQLIKNINGDLYGRGYDEKIQEILQAMNLERHYTKPQILELYLNFVGLHYASGIQAASKYYFDKDVSELTYVEAAALAVTTKNPSTLNPKDNPKENKERRNQVALDKMLEFGTITQAEYDAGIKADITIVDRTSGTDTPVNKAMQSYYVDAVIDEVIRDLMTEYGYSEEYASQMLYTAGYQVYSNMEIKTQAILEKYFEDMTTFETPQLGDAEIPQASMVICDLNGNIRALVGGNGKKDTARGYNRATMAKRAAGSTIKPLSIFAPAFENNLINWSTIMEDAPVKEIFDEELNTTRGYPQNYNWKYEGPMTIIDALKVSKNTIPFRLCQLLSPQVSFDFVYKELGLKSLVPSGGYSNVNEASMALGDGGFVLTQLTNAFQIFGNGGYYTEPKLYSKVTDAEGRIILDVTNRITTQVISPDTAYVMNKALWRIVNEAGGSGTAGKLENFETIGKTGTSSDRKDLLFMGVTPYYVAGIRYGYDDSNVVLPGAQSYQIPVWQKIMTEVHADKEPANFDLPSENTVELTYCSESGLLSTEFCPVSKSGYYRTSYMPSSCTIHDPSNTESEDEGDIEGEDDENFDIPSETNRPDGEIILN